MLTEQSVHQHPAVIATAAGRILIGTWGLQQQFLVLVVSRNVVKQLDYRLRCAKYRNTSLFQYLARLGDLFSAHETATERNTLASCHSGDPLRHHGRLCHGQRGEDDENGIDVLIATQGIDRLQIALRRRIPPQVDRIEPVPVRRQNGLQGSDGRTGKSGQGQAGCAGGVGSHGGGTGAIADDGQMLAARTESARQRLGCMK